jgi:uncharacterized protein (DUF2236 family)
MTTPTQMQEENADIVDPESLERELHVARAAAAGPNAGLLGPHSITWQVDREAAVFLGAGRALLMQLAHPWVAAAIEEHSDTFAHPIRRFHRTFNVALTMVFGSLEQSLAAARRLHARHAAITGTLPSTADMSAARSSYHANAVPALRWVHATLVETAPLAYDLVLPPLSADERARYYAESRLLACLFGIPQAALPADWAAFCAYTQKTIASGTLAVSPAARQMARRLLSSAGTWLPVPGSYRALTAQLLPPVLREQFELPFGAAEARAARRLVAWARRIYPRLPARLRYVGPYHEAQQRLAGRRHPDLLARLSNRLWIGQSSLPL